MPNYVVCHNHRKVQSTVAAESEENEDENQMDDIIADIGM
jgi:hypothetical protein